MSSLNLNPRYSTPVVQLLPSQPSVTHNSRELKARQKADRLAGADGIKGAVIDTIVDIICRIENSHDHTDIDQYIAIRTMVARKRPSSQSRVVRIHSSSVKTKDLSMASSPYPSIDMLSSRCRVVLRFAS